MRAAIERDRTRLILVIPFVILGFVLGYISSRSNGLIWLVAALSIAMPLLIMADLLRVVFSVRKFGEAKYSVGMQERDQLYNAFYILFALLAVFLIPFLFFPLLFVLPFILFLCLTIRMGVRNKIPSCVNRCGVLYWGTHHKWSDIKGYQLQNTAGEASITLFARERIAGLELDRSMCVVIGTESVCELEAFIKERMETCGN